LLIEQFFRLITQRLKVRSLSSLVPIRLKLTIRAQVEVVGFNYLTQLGLSCYDPRL